METAAAALDPKSHAFLQGLPNEQVEPLLWSGREMRFLPGDVIYREGEEANGVYLVMAGIVQIGVSGGHTVAVAKPNEIVGELSVLNSEPRTTTARAATLCVVYFVPAQAFLILLDNSKSALWALARLLATRIRTANGQTWAGTLTSVA